ncbi:MAG TPA: response regulator transcription factor [Nitrospiraceae bacterium]|nr:response regulator transcription factor [Nitrospiraceae bacterium]
MEKPVVKVRKRILAPKGFSPGTPYGRMAALQGSARSDLRLVEEKEGDLTEVSQRNNTMTKQSSKPIHVYIVDPHEIVRVGLRALLDSDPEFTVVGEATSKQQALANLVRLKPEIVILDVRLEDGSGIEAAHELLALYDKTRILFLSNSLEDQTLLSAVASGAHGYVLRDAGTETLLQALRTVARGHAYLDPRVTHHTFAYLRRIAGRTVERNSPPLSPQEQRLLPLVAQGKTNKEIAAELGLSDKTVKNYLANVYNKLHITRRSQAAAFYSKHFS